MKTKTKCCDDCMDDYFGNVCCNKNCECHSPKELPKSRDSNRQEGEVNISQSPISSPSFHSPKNRVKVISKGQEGEVFRETSASNIDANTQRASPSSFENILYNFRRNNGYDSDEAIKDIIKIVERDYVTKKKKKHNNLKADFDFLLRADKICLATHIEKQKVKDKIEELTCQGMVHTATLLRELGLNL